MLLGIETDDERRNVDDLLANTTQDVSMDEIALGKYCYSPDVSLADKDTGVMDGLGKTELVDAGLKTTLQEILDLKSQDVIELHAGLVEHTDTYETANESVTLKETLGVLLVKGQERTAHWSAWLSRNW